MIDQKIIEDGEKCLEKELQKLFSKPELTPNDWDAAKKAMCILSMMESYVNGESFDENGMSYGYRPMNHYGDYMNGYQNGENPDMNSYGRGRSPVTGRYISRGNNGGYSGHSIEDRMIMALEQQMDSAQTDYERQMVEREINRLRRGEL